MKVQIAVIISGLLLLFAACTTLTPEQKEFKSLCNEKGGEWMKMPPMKEGKFTAEEACYGCMADTMTMLCTIEEYQAYLSQKTG